MSKRPPGMSNEDWKQVQKLLRLNKRTELLHFALRPGDAFQVVAVLQYAWRNPALSPVQRGTVESLARGLQRLIARIDPEVGAILEMGWHTEYDRPKEGIEPEDN